ncbi:TetR/AcrR family transcriptional regulator [Patulibacter brassicae]|uniref:TetR/AcrR family transcriptional regulator n=1 Tax=Patulibacter brassicae TaxID=1705717 RepID=A0ABU4VQG7_9ACTN|nr:TetR/AcrR family transcriptional regulator [Patulibacter brassicae]MDX8153334.1 TetR/AcrR family transcriptional regulator [Patulibacter brassicae]
MAPRASKPLQPPREVRREQLARLFVEVVEPLLQQGETYAEISVERLITAVDISRSTFYVYFDDKGDLLRAMVEDVTQAFADAAAPWFELGPDATRKDLRKALQPLFDAYHQHQMLLGAITETAAYDQQIREQHAALVDRAVTEITRHFRAQQKLGRAAPLDAPRTARWLVWMLERGLYQLVAPAKPAEFKRLLDTATDIVWRVLYEGYRDDA